jgi:hypothetical protein
VFAAIERAIGDGSSASVSYVGFSLDHHIARKAVSPSLRLLYYLGLIEIEPGPRLVNVFRCPTFAHPRVLLGLTHLGSG